MTDSVDGDTKTFQARGAVDGTTEAEALRIARDLEAGAPVRFYRGGQPHGRVTAAKPTADGMWLKIRVTAKDPEIWKRRVSIW